MKVSWDLVGFLTCACLLVGSYSMPSDEAVDNAPLKECIASGGRPTIGTIGITCEYPDIQGHQVASTNPTGDPCPGQYEYGEKELGFHLFCFGRKVVAGQP